MRDAYLITYLLLSKKLKNWWKKTQKKLLIHDNTRGRGIGCLFASRVSSALPENGRTTEAIQNTLVPVWFPKREQGITILPCT